MKQLLVTRPQPQADEWVRSLRARGVPAQAWPLIAIVPQAGSALVQAWQTLAAFALAVFVSPNAVASFFAGKPPATAWPPGCSAGSTGPGTSQALRDAGVPAALIVEPPRDAPQFDSEALWQRLRERDWHGAGVLIVRGDGGRDWLADTLRVHGAQVSFVQAYRRALPVPDAAQRALLEQALAAPHDTCWLFSSSQALDHLRQLAPQASWAAARALATHPRIAEAAHALGFGSVHTTSPGLDAVQAAWHALDTMNRSDQRP